MFRLLVSTVLALATLAAAEKLPAPDRVPAPPTPQQTQLVREGVALHDQKDYAGAIAKYKQVLAENPWEVNALYELAYSQFVSKDYQGSIETSRLGARCRTDGVARFYMMLASALDELGKPKEAIDTYRSAIKLQPKFALLHYNLAVSLKRTKQLVEAKAAAERALECDPAHASSHAFLGQLYQEMGYRIPAMLAYSRFLQLEPEGPRAASVLPSLNQLLTAGVVAGKEPGHINIMLSSPSKAQKDEGDFTGVEMTMSIMLAADLIEKPGATKAAPKSPVEKLVSIYTSLAEGLDISKPKGGFAAAYYVPYFTALNKAGHTAAFAASAWKAANLDGAAAIDTAAFEQWSKAYAWPSGK